MLEFILSLFMIPSATAGRAPSNYDVVVETLQKIAKAYPQTSRIFELGMSDAKVMLYGLEVSGSMHSLGRINEVADLVVGTHHGNEYGSTAVALGVADSLAANPLPGHRVYIIPVLNVSGYNVRSRYESLNGVSVDSNRDYPGPCVRGSSSFRLKSTKALAEFIEQKKIVSSATLHTYSPAALYPWGISTKDLKTEYESTFIGLVKDATVESGYAYGNSTDLLYSADGTFEDYAFWKHGIWSLLFEMGDGHSPSPEQIKKMVAGNVPGMRRFFENAPKIRAEKHAFTGKCDTNVRQRTRLE
jgi:carboxypeptidase T